MKSRNVLYVVPHSKKQFGAEEKDLNAGLKILQQDSTKKVYLISIDLHNKNLIHKISDELINSTLNLADILRFVWNWASSPDYTLRQGYTFRNFVIVLRITKTLNIDTIITNTTSTLLFGKIPNIYHIHRSVCFEPIYVLKSVPNKVRAYVHAIIKYFTVIKELNTNRLLAISPRDMKFYCRLSIFNSKNLSIHVLPLRQFYYVQNIKQMKLTKALNIGFLGSTYNVLHNFKSLEYTLNTFDSEFLSQTNCILNIYGRKIPEDLPDFIYGSRVKFWNWVKKIEEIYERNQIFIVPNFLNSGMQSKVFEPLYFGRVLVCPPEVLSGYDFEAYRHYIPVKTSKDFRGAIDWLNKNRDELKIIALEAKFRATELFSTEKIKYF